MSMCANGARSMCSPAEVWLHDPRSRSTEATERLRSQSKSGWTLAVREPQTGQLHLSSRSQSRVPSGHRSMSMLIEYSQQSSPQQISRPCTPEARNSPRVAVCTRVIIESPNSTGATRRRPHQVNRPNDLLCCRARLRFTRKHPSRFIAGAGGS